MITTFGFWQKNRLPSLVGLQDCTTTMPYNEPAKPVCLELCRLPDTIDMSGPI